MKNHRDAFDAFDTYGGTYSSRKVPKWDRQMSDLLGSVDFTQEEDGPDWAKEA